MIRYVTLRFVLCIKTEVCDICQSVRSMESPELHEFILYLRPDLTEEDLIHRTKLTELIFEKFDEVFCKIVKELQVSIIKPRMLQR